LAILKYSISKFKIIYERRLISMELTNWILAGATGIMAFFTFKLFSIAKRQTKISEKQMELENSQYEPDVNIKLSSLNTGKMSKLTLNLFIRNNSNSALLIKEIRINGNNISKSRYVCRHINKDCIDNKIVLDEVVDSRYVEEIQSTYRPTIVLYITKPLKDISSDEICIKLKLHPMRANTRYQLLSFRFKISDILKFSEVKDKNLYSIPFKINRYEED
jgi:hypothetical protein